MEIIYITDPEIAEHEIGEAELEFYDGKDNTYLVNQNGWSCWYERNQVMSKHDHDQLQVDLRAKIYGSLREQFKSKI